MRDYAEAIVQTVRDPLVVLDATLRIRSVNEAFCATFQVSPLQAKDKLIYTLRGGTWKFNRLRPLLKELLAQTSTTPHLEVNSYFTGKVHKTMLFNARKIAGIDPARPLILLAIEDISARKKAQHTLEKLVISFKQETLTDAMTGLYNRRGFLTLGAQFLKIGHRLGKGIFVLFVDVDALKQINDQRGHAEGDRAIIKTAGILKKTFRQSDIVARIGGDEFAIVTFEQLPGSIVILMARLQRHLAQGNGEAPLSFSVGMAYSDSKDLSSIEELMAKADAAMYVDKKKKHDSLHLPDIGNFPMENTAPSPDRQLLSFPLA